VVGVGTVLCVAGLGLGGAEELGRLVGVGVLDALGLGFPPLGLEVALGLEPPPEDDDADGEEPDVGAS
jgi:hypothetical protein